MSTPDVDSQKRLVRRYRMAVGQTAAHLGEDLATFQPATLISTYEIDKQAAQQANKHKQRWPRRRILHASMQQVSHKIANVVDHLATLEAVFALETLRLYAPFSVTRVAVEAAAGVAYLLAHSVSAEERLIRGSALLLESFHHEVKATRELPMDDHPGVADTAEKRLIKLVAAIERAGLEVRTDSSRPTGVRWSGELRYRSIPPAKITDLVRDEFRSYPALYQMTSGVAHSMSWMLDDQAHLPDADTQTMFYAADPYAAGSAAITAIASAESVITSFGRYMGHNPEDVLVEYRRRREALDAAMHAYAVRRVRVTGRL